MKETISGYELRRYEDGVDGAGTLCRTYTVSAYGTRKRAYSAAIRAKNKFNSRNDGDWMMVFPLFDGEEPTPDGPTWVDQRNAEIRKEGGGTEEELSMQYSYDTLEYIDSLGLLI